MGDRRRLGPRLGPRDAPDPGLRDLDAAVGRRILGWTVEVRDGHPYRSVTVPANGRTVPRAFVSWAAVPHFSRDLATAWRLLDRYWGVTVERCDGSTPGCAVTLHGRQGQAYRATGATVPEAACRAALLAAGAAGTDQEGS